MFAKQLEFYLFEEILQIYSNKCQEFLREFNKILTDMCNILYPSFPNAKCHWNMLIVAHFLHVSLIETLRNVNLKFLCNTLAGSKTFYEIFMADLKEMNWVVDMIGRYEKLAFDWSVTKDPEFAKKFSGIEKLTTGREVKFKWKAEKIRAFLLKYVDSCFSILLSSSLYLSIS